MEREALIKFIKQTIPISQKEATTISTTFEPVTYSKGDYLLHQNEISDTYLYLEKGLMRTFLFDTDGNEITTDFHKENNVVFEVTSFFNRVASQANIQAVTNCRGYRLSYSELNTLFHNKPEFRDFGRAILVKEFIKSKERNYGMINKTAEERYKTLITHNAQILQYAPLKHIASYLGITDSTLSRLRGKL